MKSFEEVCNQVETYRESLKRNPREIEFIDYGAGNPSEQRTKEQMEKGVVVQVALKSLASIGVKREKAQVIYQIFAKLNPKTILELGTCCGFSSSYMSFFAPEAKIWTLEGSPNVAQIAKENHQYFNLKNIEVLISRFDRILPQLLEEIKLIDFVFIDGHHNKDATIAYFKQILPFMQRGGVMLFDDITWSEGMKEAWREIVASKAYASYENFERMGALWI